jgi:hypothetical protein
MAKNTSHAVDKYFRYGSIWSEVLGYTNSDGIAVFSELAKFVLALMTWPHSNADIERLFSQMNIIKSK